MATSVPPRGVPRSPMPWRLSFSRDGTDLRPRASPVAAQPHQAVPQFQQLHRGKEPSGSMVYLCRSSSAVLKTLVQWNQLAVTVQSSFCEGWAPAVHGAGGGSQLCGLSLKAEGGPKLRVGSNKTCLFKQKTLTEIESLVKLRCGMLQC